MEENIFKSNHISGKRLISKTYKELIQLNSKNKQTNNPILKMGRDLSTYFQRRHTDSPQVPEQIDAQHH